MFKRKFLIAGCFVAASLLVDERIFAASRLEPLTVGYSNCTGTYAPLWIAVEEIAATIHHYFDCQ